MSGQRIVDTCRALAQQQYPDDQAGAARHEIGLLRTKVLELVLQQDGARPAPVVAQFDRPAIEHDWHGEGSPA